MSRRIPAEELLAPKEIKDPDDKKPSDWVDDSMMDDPEVLPNVLLLAAGAMFCFLPRGLAAASGGGSKRGVLAARVAALQDKKPADWVEEKRIVDSKAKKPDEPHRTASAETNYIFKPLKGAPCEKPNKTI